MKRLLLALVLVAGAASILPAAAAPPVPVTGTLANAGDTVTAYCGNGESTADVFVAAGTLSGTVTVYTAANIGSAIAPLPGPTSAPPATVEGSNTLSSFPGHIHVILASSPYVSAVLTTASGGSAPAYISCSSAVAAQPPGPFVTPAPGSSGYVALYPSAQPSGQNGSAYLGGGYFAFPASASPSPVVGSTGPVGFYVNTTGGGFITNNYDDGSGQTHNALTIAYNNQGNQENIITFSRSGNISVNGGKYTATAIATPPAPVPTCTPGGSNSSTQYWVKINYVNNTGKSTSSPESTVTCASGTLLQVPLSVTNYTTSKFWTVSATTAGTGQEKEQTQGTSPSSGTNIPLSTTIWTSTATLAGSTAASSSDSSLDCWGDSTLLVMALCPEGQSLLSNPLKVASLSNGSTTASFVAPVYTNAGSAVGSTYHGSQFTCTFSASTTCVLGASYWTGSSVFSSSSSIDGCSLKHSAASTVTFGFEQTGTATGTVTATASNSETVTGVCWGT